MLYPSAHTVIVSGNEVELTHKEYELLHLFLQNKNQVFSREQLLNVFGDLTLKEIHELSIHTSKRSVKS